MWLWPFGPTLKLPDRWVTDMTTLLVPLSFALTTLTPFRAHPSDGPKLILKAPASSWECGSETTLWSKETLTKGGVWFPPLSSKWIHTVGACVREFVRVCVCVFLSLHEAMQHTLLLHTPPHQVTWLQHTQPQQLFLQGPSISIKQLVDNERDNLITLVQFCFHIPDDQKYMFPC